MFSLYPLTGPPGGGKTSIIDALREMQEFTCPEAGRIVIEQCQAEGINRPWEREGFQTKIFELQCRQETDGVRGVRVRTARVFCDRGLGDNLAYLRFNRMQKGAEYGAIAAQIGPLAERYSVVFFVEPYCDEQFTCVADGVRHESPEQAREIARHIRDIYKEHSCRIVVVPGGGRSPQERAQWILEHLGQPPVSSP